MSLFYVAAGGDPSDLRLKNDGIFTTTTNDQMNIEEIVDDDYYAERRALGKTAPPLVLDRERHVKYLRSGLKGLAESFRVLDASRPWLIYWITHALDLMGAPLSDDEREQQALRQSCLDTLRRCQHPEGGFGGGPGQLPHLAPTYAAVNCLAILGPDALDIVDRPKLQAFLMRMHQPSGAFTMHEDGELDVRGAYCAASAATICRLDLGAIFTKTPEWIAACQTYEGGISAVPGTEAHGGYAFCGLAALRLLGDTSTFDLQALKRWAVMRQMRLEGGFQGRTNKLVDGCYSFWVGGVFPLLQEMLGDSHSVLHPQALSDYVLVCCQHERGGLIDKPTKHRDFYHSCYCLSGLACLPKGTTPAVLATTHRALNIGMRHYDAAQAHFAPLQAA